MIKKEGKFPVNARVDVDYSKGKPKIKFSYPMKNPKKEAPRQAESMALLFLIWILIGIIPILFYQINNTLKEQTYPVECGNFSLDKLEYNWTKTYYGDLNLSFNDSYKAVYGFNVTCDNKILSFDYREEQFYQHFSFWNFVHSKSSLLSMWLYFSLLLSWIFTRLLTRILVKKKWYRKWFPKAQAEGIIFKTKTKKYLKFYPKDVFNNIAFVPYFSNVELDYKTEGDFSNKLLSIKIREYRGQKINIKTGKKSEVKVDNFKWYAIFYFRDKPKDGYLEVVYQ